MTGKAKRGKCVVNVENSQWRLFEWWRLCEVANLFAPVAISGEI